MKTFMKTIFILTILCFQSNLFASPNFNANPPDDKEQVLKTIKTMFKGFFNRDANLFVSHLSDNASFVNPYGQFSQGKSTVKKEHEVFFEQIGASQGGYEWTNTVVQFLRPDIATAVVQYDNWETEDGAKTKWTIGFTLSKAGDQWSIEMVQLTPPPAPGN